MIKNVLVVILLTATACAESLEVGGSAGGGALGISSGGSAAAGSLGVEACVFCGGRFALVGEYSHWFSASNERSPFATDRVESADLAGAGLRIQTRGRTRFFFDAGFAGGRDHHVGGGGGAIGGAVVGSGVRIPWGDRWYIRPEVRGYALSPHSIEGVGIHWAVSGGIGLGYVF